MVAQEGERIVSVHFDRPKHFIMYNAAWCNHVDVQIMWWMEKGDMWVEEADVSAWSVVHLQAFMSSPQSPSM